MTNPHARVEVEVDRSRIPIDPRIRQRRVAVIRQTGRRRRRILMAVALTTAVAVAVLAIGHSRLVSARHVSVRGAVHTPAEQIVRVAGLAGGPPMLDVSSAAADARLRRLAWVATAVVTRHWPDSVRVVITERRPVAIVARTGGLALVDATGRVLSWHVSGMVLPVLTSSATPGRPGTVLSASAGPGLAAARHVPPVLAGRIVAVHVGPGRTVTLDLGAGVVVVLGRAVDLTAKFEALASLLAGAPPAGPATIDVTVPSELTVGPPAPSAPA